MARPYWPPIVAVEVNPADWLSLIFYRSVFLHLYAREALDDVDYGVVFGSGVACDVEHKRIAPGVNVGSLDYHFLQTRDFRIESDSRKIGRKRQSQRSVSHQPESDGVASR